MPSRREFLAGSIAFLAAREDFRAAIEALPASGGLANDESYWQEIRDLFYIDPELTVFNHVGLSPTPKAVIEREYRERIRAASDPSYHMWRKQDGELLAVREQLGKLIGCKEDEMALVANATVGLQTTILGLPLDRGDEIVLAENEYPRAMTAVEQRVARDGAVAKKVSMPPTEFESGAVVRRFETAMTDKTRLVVMSRKSYLNGQILPVREVAQLCAERKIPLVCDAAQSIGILPDTVESLGNPIYLACGHKWLMGPPGTGLLVVKKPWLEKIWPLHSADIGLKSSPRKFEQQGTRSIPALLSLLSALELHNRIGLEAKAARIQYLRETIAGQILEIKGASLVGSLNPATHHGMVTFKFEGKPSREIVDKLMSAHKIHVVAANRGQFDGVRISPNVFTSPVEIKRLVEALAAIVRS